MSDQDTQDTQDTKDRIAQFDRSIARAELQLSGHHTMVRHTQDVLDSLRRQRAAIVASQPPTPTERQELR